MPSGACVECVGFEGFEREAEECICSYANCLNTVGSFMKNVNLTVLRHEYITVAERINGALPFQRGQHSERDLHISSGLFGFRILLFAQHSSFANGYDSGWRCVGAA